MFKQNIKIKKLKNN